MKKFYMIRVLISKTCRPSRINKRSAITSFVLLLLVAFFVSNTLMANNALSYERGDTITWSQDQNIDGTFEVGADEVLKILPGVNVLFITEDSKLIINGEILAEGSQAFPIVFSGNGSSTWSGITLSNAAPSVFKYCNFSGIALNDLKGDVTRSQGGINILFTNHVLFDHCNYTGNYHGIGVYNSVNVSFFHCSFKNNEMAAYFGGLINFDNSSADTIRNCEFLQNKANFDGIITVRNGSGAVIQNNTFRQTSFIPPIFGNTTYAIILSKDVALGNHLVINSNLFTSAVVPTGNELCEILIRGDNRNIDLSTALIWNNTFYGYPFYPPLNAPKTAMRLSLSTISATHNLIKGYNKCGVKVMNSDVNLNLNTFESNHSTEGALHFGDYFNYTGRPVHNVVFANVFKNNDADFGGAIQCLIAPLTNVQTTIEQNTFLKNYCDGGIGKGGAIYNASNGNLLIKNNVFDQNYTDFDGGAIFVNSNISASDGITVIEGNDFFDNHTSNRGGAIFINKSKVRLENNQLNSNQALLGGGLFVNCFPGSEFINNTIQMNSAGRGAGIYLSGTIAREKKIITSDDNIIFMDNMLDGNMYDEKGGGLFIENSENTLFIRNLISNNEIAIGSYSHEGGGVFVVNSSLEFYNCNIVGNTADDDKGAVYFDISEAHTLTFQNCNVANHGAMGGLVFANKIQPANINIYNSIFYENNAGASGQAIIYNSTNEINTFNCFVDVLPTSFDVNFVDEQLGLWPGWEDDTNFYLICDNSICVDNGNNDVIYDDLPGEEPTLALFPSCGNLTNDIGISGGPFALDNPMLFQPQLMSFQIADNANLNLDGDAEALTFNAEILSDEKISLYPNPTQGILNVLISGAGHQALDLILLDSYGRIVLREDKLNATNNTIQLDLSGQAHGMYFLRIVANQQSFTRKIILE